MTLGVPAYSPLCFFAHLSHVVGIRKNLGDHQPHDFSESPTSVPKGQGHSRLEAKILCEIDFAFQAALISSIVYTFVLT